MNALKIYECVCGNKLILYGDVVVCGGCGACFMIHWPPGERNEKIIKK